MLIKHFEQAAKIAIPKNRETDQRSFWIGSIGIRQDGVLVSSKNGGAKYSTSIEMQEYHKDSKSHAEGRLMRKMGKGGIVYVARVLRKDGRFAMSRPCSLCQMILKSSKIDKVFYTINEFQYGIWYVKIDKDIVHEFS